MIRTLLNRPILILGFVRTTRFSGTGKSSGPSFGNASSNVVPTAQRVSNAVLSSPVFE